MEACDIGPHERTWGGRKLEVGGKQWFYFREGDPPPHFDQDAEGYVGHHKGFAQVLYERGKYVEGMTADGEKHHFVPEDPSAWQPCDLVLRNEEESDGDGNVTTSRYVYRVLTVPADHDDVKSEEDDILVEWMVQKQWRGHAVYVPSGKKWTFKSNTLTSIPRDSYKIESGKMKNKRQLKLVFDAESYWQSLHNPTVNLGACLPRG